MQELGAKQRVDRGREKVPEDPELMDALLPSAPKGAVRAAEQPARRAEPARRGPPQLELA